MWFSLFHLGVGECLLFCDCKQILCAFINVCFYTFVDSPFFLLREILSCNKICLFRCLVCSTAGNCRFYCNYVVWWWFASIVLSFYTVSEVFVIFFFQKVPTRYHYIIPTSAKTKMLYNLINKHIQLFFMLFVVPNYNGYYYQKVPKTL